MQRTPTKFLLSNVNPIGSSAIHSLEAAGSIIQGGEDSIEVALRNELNSCGENGDHIQVFEVEKIYVLVGGGGDEGPDQSTPAVVAKSTEEESKPAASTLQYSFIRRRSQKGFSVYGHTTVSTHASGERVEVKRIISKREYEWMKTMYADASRHIVVQRRYCFLWQGKTFSLYRYLEPLHSLYILHCQAKWRPKDETEEGDQIEDGPTVNFPPFLNVVEPLNEDGKFSAYHISLKSETNQA